MRRASGAAEKIDPVIHEFPVKYQHDRTGWMAWPEGLPVSAIASTKSGARLKLRGALRAYFRTTLRHGDPLPALRRASTLTKLTPVRLGTILPAGLVVISAGACTLIEGFRL